MTTTTAPPGVELLDIPLDLIVDHPDNIRIELGDLTELSASIERVGISVPLLVLPANADGVHYLIDGHRRLHAARSTPSLRPAPCLVRDLTEAQVVETMLVTGLRRREISPLEEARGYQRLIELDTKLADIANAVGATQKHVKARLALLQLPDTLLQMVHTGRVTITAATDILKFAADDDALAHAVEYVTRHPDANSLRITNEVTNYVSDRDRRRALADARDQLAADGIGEYTRSYWVPPERLTGLHDVVAVTALKLTAAQTRKHASDPCHKAHVSEESHYRDGATTWDVVVTPVCTRPEYHTAEFEDSPSKLRMKPDTYKHLLDKRDPNAKPAAPAGDYDQAAPAGDYDQAARGQAAEARRKLCGTLYRGGALATVLPMVPLVAAQMLELLTEWDYESAIAQCLILAFPDEDVEDLGPEMYTWPVEHLAAAVVLERLEDIWRRNTPKANAFGEHMVTLVEEAAAVEYFDVLQKAGHKLSRIERSDLKELQGRIAARAEQAAAEAAETQRRTDEEQNPTVDIAQARFEEAGPDALAALAELIIHEDTPHSPYPVLDDEDALRNLELAGLGIWADTDDGKVFRTTGFARTCLDLVPDALDGAVEAIGALA